MNAIETMMEEHRLIEKVLEALEAYATALSHDEPVDRGDLARFLEFIREYADGRHHGKEEEVLFEIMATNGFSRETCPLAVMYHEHRAGRDYVRSMAALAEQESWTQEEKGSLVATARAFATLLREHIMKEDNVLFPLARAQLPESAMAAVETRCAELDGCQAEDGTEERLARLGRDLCSKYLDASAGGSVSTGSPRSPTQLTS